MKSITILVADAARARIFTFQPFESPPARLVERAELVDPAWRLQPGELVARALEVVEQTDSYRLIVAASPPMLGLLRAHLTALRPRSLAVEELALDLTREPAPRVLHHLVKLRLLPVREAA